MPSLAEAFVRLRLDSRGTRREAERDFGDAGRGAGRSFEDGFNRTGGGEGLGRRAADSFRRGLNQGGGLGGAGAGLGAGLGDVDLSDAGRRAGQSFGNGFSTDAAGRLRDARGRFARELENGPPLRLPTPEVPTPRVPPIPNPPPVRVDVDVDTAGARAAITGLLTDITRLAAIPVAATAGVGIAALGGAALAAGAGFAALKAVAVPSIERIKEALAAKDAAEGASGASDAASQARAFALAGARQQLAAAIRNQAQAHAQAVQQVEQAERQLASAEDTAASAALRIADARREATRALADMRDRLADTKLAIQADAMAVDDAKRRLDELNKSQEVQLALRNAQLGLKQAEARLNETLKDPEATDLEKEQAQLAVDSAKEQVRQAEERAKYQKEEIKRAALAWEQAKQRYKEQRRALKELAEDEKKASKAGIDGSQQVLDARESLAQANQQVADSERALAQARANVARTDRASADGVASARRSLAQAMLSGASGTDAYAEALAKLSPSERKLLKDTEGLKTAFDGWQAKMQPEVLPLFSKGIGILKSQIPSLTPFVTGAADAVGGLLDRVAAGAKSAGFREFKDQLAELVPTAITGFGNAAGDVAVGIGRMVQAFLPYAPTVLQLVQDISGAFREWASDLAAGDNAGFEAFLKYVVDNAPFVGQTLLAVGDALVHVVTSIAPIAGALGLGALGTFGLLAKAISGLSPGQIQALAIAFVALRTAMAVGKVAKVAVDGVRSVNAAFAAGSQGPLWARALTGAWNGLKNIASSARAAAASMWAQARASAASAAANLRARAASAGNWLMAQATALRAVAAAQLASARAAGASALAAVRQRVATIASTAASVAATVATRAMAAGQWLLNAALSANPIGLIVVAIAALVAAIVIAYKNSETFRAIVQACWAGIQQAVSAAWDLIRTVFGAIVGFITGTLGPVFTALWQDWIQPALNAIGLAAQAAWTVYIRPAFQAVSAFITGTLAPVVMWLWSNVVQPAFAGIGVIVSAVWTGVIRPAFQALSAFISNVLAPVISWLWRTIIQPAFAGIGLIISTAWTTVIRPVLQAVWAFVTNTLGPVFTWLWQTIIQPAWTGIRTLISAVWTGGIQPVFNALKNAVEAVATSFGVGADAIKMAWSKIEDYAKKPVNFVIGTVYNKGIRGLWNNVIGWLKLPDSMKLGEIPQLKAGGTLDQPAKARPMMTNGPMAIVGEGNPAYPEFVIPTDPKYRGRAQAMMKSAAYRMDMQMLAPGGILGVGDLWDGVKDFAGDVVDIGDAALDLITNPKAVWDKLAAAIPKGNGEGPWGTAINAIPPKMLDSMWSVAEKIVKAFGDGYGGKGADGGLKWARKQVGKPYLWGGVGPGGFDCSGFISALVNVIRGVKNPYSRLFTTHSFDAKGGPGFTRNAASALTVGVTNAGVGHMAGTLLGQNVESSGSYGVRVGGGARGANDALFPYQYGLKFDGGGWLPPVNETKRPEPVLTAAQWSALITLAERGARGGPLIGEAHIHEEIDVDRVMQRLTFLESTGSF